MKAHQRPIGKNDEWLTPPEILRALGDFDLDPCAPRHMPWPTAEVSYCEAEDGLSVEWKRRVWCNPPFNRFQRPKWMKRMAEHGNGIMLVPAATETKAFYKYVWEAADAVCFMRGRPYFHYVDGTRAAKNCGTAIVLVAYGHANAVALERSGLGVVVNTAKKPVISTANAA